MKITHSVQLLIKGQVEDDFAKEKIVNYIIDNYPDAFVTGPPKIRHEMGMTFVMQSFTSEAYTKMLKEIMETFDSVLDAMVFEEETSEFSSGWNSCIESLKNSIAELLEAEGE